MKIKVVIIRSVLILILYLETIKKRNNTTSKFKKTNSVATQNFEEISRRGTHQSEDMATKERTKPVTRDETKRE